MNNYRNISEKVNNSIESKLTEKQVKAIQSIKDLFEGSVVSIEPVIKEPVIDEPTLNVIENPAKENIVIEPVISVSESKIKDFRSAYSLIMQKYKPNHNIKPCIAYVLVNGISDGWRRNAPAVAYECLRVFDRDMSKAWELLKLYYENSMKKRTRTLSHLSEALKWVYLHKEFKVSCSKLSREMPCVGDKNICYNIRGIRKSDRGNTEGNIELFENQKLLYFNRFIDHGYFLTLTGKAVKIYLFLLQKYFKEGFNTLFLSYRELAKATRTEYQHIATYLKELKKANLISYIPGKTQGKERKATEIKLLDITGRNENRAEAIFKQLFRN
jgi:hypothetical protein